MFDRIRSLFLRGLAVTAAAAGCAGPHESPTLHTSTTPPPITAAALDVSRYVATPCAGVPIELAAHLNLPERKNAHETVLIGAGNQAQCQLSSGPPLSAAAEVRFYPNARPLPLITGTDGSFTSCQIIVDIAGNQGLGTLFNGASGQPITTSCANAKELATGTIA